MRRIICVWFCPNRDDKGKNARAGRKIDEKDVIDHLGAIPAPKIHCACLAKRTLRGAIKSYKQIDE